MKQLMRVFIMIILILSFVGCNKKEPTLSPEESAAEAQSLKESIKESIKAELETTTAPKETTAPETSTPEESSTASETSAPEETTVEETTTAKPKEQSPTIVSDNGITTTFVHFNDDTIDTSGLSRKLVDIKSKMSNHNGSEVYKIAVFGKITDVEISLSHSKDTAGDYLTGFDSIEDTEIILTTKEIESYETIVVTFDDGRFNHRTVHLANSSEVEKTEIQSGLSDSEQSQTTYANYDVSEYTQYLGMTKEDFDRDLMTYSIEYTFYDNDTDATYYTIDTGLSQIAIQFVATSQGTIDYLDISVPRSYINDYTNMVSFFGIDFHMKEIQARYIAANLSDPRYKIEVLFEYDFNQMSKIRVSKK